jgi:hypothetical protein
MDTPEIPVDAAQQVEDCLCRSWPPPPRCARADCELDARGGSLFCRNHPGGLSRDP